MQTNVVAGENVAMPLERRYWSSVEITNKVWAVRKLVEIPNEGDETMRNYAKEEVCCGRDLT
jgi:ABC-type methionine transport system ATPase subunit